MLIGIIILCALLYLSLLGFKTMYALIALANMPVNRETGVKRFRVQGEAASRRRLPSSSPYSVVIRVWQKCWRRICKPCRSSVFCG
jgi:hypothetical protein